MRIFHTSPTPILKISSAGRFGEFLFFSSKTYVMTAAENYVAYEIDLDENDVIDAGQLFYHEDAAKLDDLVAQVASRFGVDVDDAEALISEHKSIFDIDSNVDAEDLSDAAWDVQAATARAAKHLGYRAVAVNDEQGGAYLVDMLGRESELRRVE